MTENETETYSRDVEIRVCNEIANRLNIDFVGEKDPAEWDDPLAAIIKHIEGKRGDSKGIESSIDELDREQIHDLLKAYDSYIGAAFDARLPETGWTPVCVNEFYDAEYKNVWLEGSGFDYMYDEGEITENSPDYSLGSEVQDAVAAKEGLSVEAPGVTSGRAER